MASRPSHHDQEYRTLRAYRRVAYQPMGGPKPLGCVPNAASRSPQRTNGRREGQMGASSCSIYFRDETASPVTILDDHGILNWSIENADAEQERKTHTRDRD